MKNYDWKFLWVVRIEVGCFHFLVLLRVLCDFDYEMMLRGLEIGFEANVDFLYS